MASAPPPSRVKNATPNSPTRRAMITAKAPAIIHATTANVAARALSCAPSARATAAEIAPPMAPADSICVNMTSGNTSARPASAVTPRRLAKYASDMLCTVCTNIAKTLGAASLASVGAIGASSRARVRVARAWVAAAERAGAAFGVTRAISRPCRAAMWRPDVAWFPPFECLEWRVFASRFLFGMHYG